jgi:hypothetical protein
MGVERVSERKGGRQRGWVEIEIWVKRKSETMTKNREREKGWETGGREGVG